MNNSIYIYKLSDPRNASMCYIGNTNNPKRRLNDHIGQRFSDDCKKNLWIRELIGLRLRPVMDVLCVVNEDNRFIVEENMIKHYRQFNTLMNSTEGGAGANGFKLNSDQLATRVAINKELSIANKKNGVFERTQKRMLLNNPMKNRNISSIVSEHNRVSGVYEKARNRMLGEDNPGKKQMRPVLQYDINGVFIAEWPCAAHAAKHLGTSGSAITKGCKNYEGGNLSIGFIWKYKNLSK